MDNLCPADIIASYKSTQSIRATARKHNISPQTTRRILLSSGCIIGDTRAGMIHALLSEMSPEDVAAKLNMSLKTVLSYAPYTKGSYTIGEKSPNAKRIAKCRQGKSTIPKKK